MDERYDIIVVGGGSAGCIVAAELATEPARKILLLEAGPVAEAHPETLHADADASAVPTTPVSALSAPSMLIGYRAAQFIRR